MANNRPPEYVYIPGKVKWAQIKDIDPLYGNWYVTIYPDPNSLEKLRDLQAEGMKNVLKKDEDGSYIKFSRYPAKTFKAGNQTKTIHFAPPTVVDRDGQPFTDLIGRGTDATIKIEVYEHNVPGSSRKAKAARFESLMIDNLVPYTKKDFGSEQEYMVKGLDGTPRQAAW